MRLCNSDEATLEYFLTKDDLESLECVPDHATLYSRDILLAAAKKKYGNCGFIQKKYSRHATEREAVDEYFLATNDIADLAYVKILKTKYYSRQKLFDIAIAKYGREGFEERTQKLEDFEATEKSPISVLAGIPQPKRSPQRSAYSLTPKSATPLASLDEDFDQENGVSAVKIEDGLENLGMGKDDKRKRKYHKRVRNKKNQEVAQDEETSEDVESGKFSHGRWTAKEHELFLKGLKLFGRSWSQHRKLITTRSSMQIRTHAQKYFKRVGACPEVDEITRRLKENKKQENEKMKKQTQEGVNTKRRRGRPAKERKASKKRQKREFEELPTTEHNAEEELAAAGFLSLQHAA